MDRFLPEDSIVVRSAAAVAAVLICAVLGFGVVLNRALGEVHDSMARGFVIVEHVDGIVDELDSLDVDQRALLSTGGERFSEGVAVSVTGLISHVDALRQLHFDDPVIKRQVARMSHSVDMVLDIVGKSNDLQQLFGSPVGLALLDGDGDSSIMAAKSEAVLLKRMATERVLHGMHRERRLGSVLRILF